jgi:hypothetical protein
MPFLCIERAFPVIPSTLLLSDQQLNFVVDSDPQCHGFDHTAMTLTHFVMSLPQCVMTFDSLCHEL